MGSDQGGIGPKSVLAQVDTAADTRVGARVLSGNLFNSRGYIRVHRRSGIIPW